mmetsp:Transcript_70868/g.189100  ORF Transcript_70868/g.189100 Transcript_70868/m.189100 type:complete len:227 (+) Transcript_70868:85-765(+)
MATSPGHSVLKRFVHFRVKGEDVTIGLRERKTAPRAHVQELQGPGVPEGRPHGEVLLALARGERVAVVVHGLPVGSIPVVVQTCGIDIHIKILRELLLDFLKRRGEIRGFVLQVPAPIHHPRRHRCLVVSDCVSWLELLVVLARRLRRGLRRRLGLGRLLRCVVLQLLLQALEDAPVVDVAEVPGQVHSASAEHLQEVIMKSGVHLADLALHELHCKPSGLIDRSP